MRSMSTITRQELRLLAVDPFPFMLLIVMPLALVPFFTGGLIGGAVTSVPGMAALFGYLGMAVVTFVYMRDHGWRTWDRLRTSGASPVAVLVGKAIPLFVLFLAQQVVLFAVGLLLLGMPWRGSVMAGGVMMLVIVLGQVSMGLAITIHARSVHHANILIQAGALLAAGIGGALAPVSAFPGWMQHLAPISPVYWSLKGSRGVVSLGWGFQEIGRPVLVLTGLSLSMLLLTIGRYRHDEVKVFYV